MRNTLASHDRTCLSSAQLHKAVGVEKALHPGSGVVNQTDRAKPPPAMTAVILSLRRRATRLSHPIRACRDEPTTPERRSRTCPTRMPPPSRAWSRPRQTPATRSTRSQRSRQWYDLTQSFLATAELTRHSLQVQLCREAGPAGGKSCVEVRRAQPAPVACADRVRRHRFTRM